MSDDMREQECRRHAGELPELALGVLTGRERAEALSHVESCPRCADELEQLSRAADTVVQAAPDVEPPVGFEVRLFERMGVTAEPSRPRRLRKIRPAYWVPATIAAAAAAAGPRSRAGPVGVVPVAHRGGGPDPAAEGGRGRPRAERADGRARQRLQRRKAVDVDDAGRLGGTWHGQLRRRDRRRPVTPRRNVRRQEGLRGLGGAAQRRAFATSAPRRSYRPAGRCSPPPRWADTPRAQYR